VIACQAGYVVMLGIDPLLLAPLSETFGKKHLYHVCITFFALPQVPASLSLNVAMLITVKTVSGFFGSRIYWSTTLKGNRYKHS
jgi:MFS family permease